MADRRTAGCEDWLVPVAPGPMGRQLTAQGRQGEVRFTLYRVDSGLYVERQDLPRRGLRTAQSLCFSEPAAFVRWCDDDAVRFDHPHLFVKLKREAEHLWSIDGPGPAE